jgi:hypothetical protein
MDKTDAQQLIKLRNYVIGYYKTLDGADSVTAVVEQKTVAIVLESIIHSLDDLLKEHVKFK